MMRSAGGGSGALPLVAVTAVVFFFLGRAMGPQQTAAPLPVRFKASGLHGSGGGSGGGGCSPGTKALAVAQLPAVRTSVQKITMLVDKRLDNIIELIGKAVERGLPGDVLEAGVWQGGASILIKATLEAHCSTKQLYCADSYQGLPSFTETDNKADLVEKPMDKPGSYAFDGGVDTVRRNFASHGLLDDRVHFVVGYFNETLPKLAPEPRQLAVLRMDGDMYSSTMDILTNLYHRVVPGGYVIIDDYGWWPQCKKAVHDFFDARGEGDVLKGLHVIDETGVWFEKPGGPGSNP